MRLYKITAPTYNDNEEHNAVAWAGTQADAKATAKAMQPGVYKPSIEEVDFPTDKPNLLAWLNAHFNRDNG